MASSSRMCVIISLTLHVGCAVSRALTCREMESDFASQTGAGQEFSQTAEVREGWGGHTWDRLHET